MRLNTNNSHSVYYFGHNSQDVGLKSMMVNNHKTTLFHLTITLTEKCRIVTSLVSMSSQLLPSWPNFGFVCAAQWVRMSPLHAWVNAPSSLERSCRQKPNKNQSFNLKRSQTTFSFTRLLFRWVLRCLLPILSYLFMSGPVRSFSSWGLQLSSVSLSFFLFLLCLTKKCAMFLLCLIV